MNYSPISVRLGPRERGVLDDLADRLGESRTGVIRLGLQALDEKVAQGRESEATTAG